MYTSIHVNIVTLLFILFFFFRFIPYNKLVFQVMIPFAWITAILPLVNSAVLRDVLVRRFFFVCLVLHLCIIMYYINI